eukprot:CAMPEP_0174999046 /NCGR_PEP_ID=MMETSP0005-20121125/1835_1 /TAXON_ID=420556 /ORGANISM="Ochromonas sp., Strain CCMP1393" /LENGTH=311 /DNA_ID=CAMNT_0016253727 /DNA_START=1 /DNA_END=936 /DNA_ORIENTATION=+
MEFHGEAPISDMEDEDVNAQIESFEEMTETFKGQACVSELYYNIALMSRLKQQPDLIKARMNTDLALQGGYPLAQYDEACDIYRKGTDDWTYALELLAKAAFMPPYNNPERDEVMRDCEVRRVNIVSSHKLMATIYEDHVRDDDKALTHYRASLLHDPPLFDCLISCGEYLLKFARHETTSTPLNADEIEVEGKNLLFKALKDYDQQGMNVFSGTDVQPPEYYTKTRRQAHIALYNYYKGFGGLDGGPKRAGDVRACAKHYREAHRLGFRESKVPAGPCILTHPAIRTRMAAISLVEDNDETLSEIDYAAL